MTPSLDDMWCRLRSLLGEYGRTMDRIVTEGREDHETMDDLTESIENLKLGLSRVEVDLDHLKRATPNTTGIFSGPYMVSVVIEQDGSSIILSHEGSGSSRLDDRLPVARIRTGPDTPERFVFLREEELDYIRRWAVDALRIEEHRKAEEEGP